MIVAEEFLIVYFLRQACGSIPTCKFGVLFRVWYGKQKWTGKDLIKGVGNYQTTERVKGLQVRKNRHGLSRGEETTI